MRSLAPFAVRLERNSLSLGCQCPGPNPRPVQITSAGCLEHFAAPGWTNGSGLGSAWASAARNGEAGLKQTSKVSQRGPGRYGTSGAAAFDENNGVFGLSGALLSQVFRPQINTVAAQACW